LNVSIDVNILVYDADEKSPFHRRAKEFLVRLFESDRVVCLTFDTLHSLLRLATHPRLFPVPMPPSSAVDHIKKIVAHPNTHMLGPTAESLEILSRLVKDMHITGGQISDAVTASILEANGIRTIYTNDRDYWKFPALKPVDPFK
jgi:uncharacterized protein